MKTLIYFATLSLFAMGCKKDLNPSSADRQSLKNESAASLALSTTTAANVYVAGNLLWKNGVATGTATGLSSVFVSTSNDVYLTGGNRVWKNNVATNLSGGGTGNAVYVSGTDVYVAGNIGNTAKVWKNNVATTLPAGTVATSVFVLGTDVYVAGYQDVSTFTRLTIARLWKNGQLVTLSGVASTPTPSTSSTATSVYVSGTNVYVAGYVGFTPVFWRNSVRNILTQPNGSAFPQSIFVSGTDVYVAGYAYSSNNDFAVLWKNNVLTTVSPTNARAQSVFVSGANVYVAGQKFTSDGNVDDVPVTTFQSFVWKNGVVTNLPNGTVARSVFVR